MKSYLSADELNRLYPAQEFTIATEDKKTVLNGQINFPASAGKKTPLIIMCPGSGLHNRDYLIGESNTNNDFVFLCLAQDLLAAGMAVARYDSRGVTGHHRDPLLDKPEFILQRDLAFMENFIDADIRRTVTPRSQYEDVFSVYNYFSEYGEFINNQKIILLGHSEGALNISG